MKILKFLINTNLFISLAALLMTVQSQVQLGMSPAFHPYLFIIFFATLFEYNLHRLITLAYHPNALLGDKHKWLRENKKSFYILVIFSVLGFLVSIWLAKPEVLLALLPIALLTLFYTLPIHRIRQKMLRLREVPGLKIFMIAFIWAAVTVLLPVIESGGDFESSHVLLMIVERSFFIFAITLPFDIRDIETDTQAGLKTIPTVLGADKAFKLSYLSVLGFMLIACMHYYAFNQNSLIPACLISGLFTLYVLQNENCRNSAYYHYGILDGCIIVQSVLVILFYYTK